MPEKHWWTMYGPFESGVDNLPHMGQVLSHYARLHGIGAATLAHILTEHGWRVGERRIEQLMSQHNIDDPQQISRRRLLAQILAIPPVILGITDIVARAELHTPTRQARPSLGSDSIPRYESTLAIYWDSFYSSSIERYWASIEQWYLHLDELRTATGGSQRLAVLALLCRFGQLAAVTARDRLDYATAMRYHNQSVALATELDNTELIAASLVRRARTFAKQGELGKALSDLKQAIPFANRSRPNLRGYTFQAAADIISQFPQSQESTVQYQRLMDAAGRIIRNSPLEDDGSFMRLTAAGYHQDRARGLLRLGCDQQALDAIATADRANPPTMTRWHAESAILRAQAYAQAGEIEWACTEIETAVRLVRATTSKGKRQKLATIYRTIAKHSPNQPTLRHIQALVSE